MIKLKENVLVTLLLLLLVSFNSHAVDYEKLLKDAIVKGIKDGLQQSNTNTAAPTSVLQDQPSTTKQTSDVVSNYSGSIRWDLDNRTVENIGRAAVRSANVKNGKYNQAFIQKTFQESSASWSFLESSNFAGKFWNTQNHGSQKPIEGNMIRCVYKSSNGDKEDIIFWQVGNRLMLPEGNFNQKGWDGYADAEINDCPQDLASAIEAGFGSDVWSRKDIQYRQAVEDRLNYETKTLTELDKEAKKMKEGKPKPAAW